MENKKSQSASLFFVLTLGWTWLFWGLAVAAGRPIDHVFTAVLTALGGVGPMAAAIILLFTVNSPAERRDFAVRLLHPRRIGPVWWGVIFLFTPLLTLGAFLLSALIFGTPFRINPEGEFLSRSLGGILWIALFTLFFGPVPEELGWRGYALDRIQKRHSALAAALLLAGVWAAWHLPLFFIQGSYQNSLTVGSLVFWRYMLAILPEAVFITWIYNNTGRSILAAILFHFVTNFNPVEGIFATRQVGAAYLPAEESLWILFVLRFIAAGVILIIWGPKRLSRKTD